MRKTALNCVYELAKSNPDIFFIGSDLGVDTLKAFKEEMPERFLMEGVSEANVVGMAAGLALEGKTVYVNTIATFLTRRCFEQVVLDLGLHNVKVRLIGNGGGVVYAPLGPTHLAIDDIAIMRAIPNVTIVACADAVEMKKLIVQTVDYPGPMYIRLAKGHDPLVTQEETPFEIGKAIRMKRGDDGLILTTGITLRTALEAIKTLEVQGLDVGIVHVPTIKPLDTDFIRTQIDAVPLVVSVEEHTIMGGLGSAIAELIAESTFEAPKGFKRIGIPDIFPDQYGSQDSLMERCGVSAGAIVAAIWEISKKYVVSSR